MKNRIFFKKWNKEHGIKIQHKKKIKQSMRKIPKSASLRGKKQKKEK